MILNATSPLSCNFLSANTCVDRDKSLYSSSSRSAKTLIKSIFYGCFSRKDKNNSALKYADFLKLPSTFDLFPIQ